MKRYKPMRLAALAAAILIVISLAGCAQSFQQRPQSNEPYQLKVVMLDVGQGDSILVCSAGKFILVDGGENDRGKDVVKDLKRLGVDRLTAVIGTHPHSDHIGGLDTVLKAFPVDTVYLPRRQANTKTYEDLLDAISQSGLKVTVPNPGDTIKLGEADIRFLWPDKGLATEDDNEYSIVVMVTAAKKSVLLTGDIGNAAEKKILQSGEDIRCDVLKVAHHGSNTSSTKAFLKAANPRYALISVGAGNDYNHPNPDAIKRLSAVGAEVHRTDLDGEITVTVSSGQLSVQNGK